MSLSCLLAPASVRAKTQSDAAVTITDQTGQRITLSRPARRIIVIPIPMASMLMAVDGGTAKIMGMNAVAKSDLTEGLLGRMFPAARAIPTDVAGDNFAPSGEALAAARPDLVLQWGDRGDAIIEPMRALGLPVLGFRYGDSLLAADWLRLLGEAVGRPERGRQLAEAFERRVGEIAALAASVPQAEKPRAIYLNRARSGFTVAGGGSSMDADIRRAGGINPAAGLPAFSAVDVEQLLAWNPDVVLLNNFEPGLAPNTLYADPRLRGLKAVQTRRVYLYPRGGFRWDPPSQETPLSTEWLFKVLHPARAAQTGDLRRNVAAAYQELYGYAVSEAEIDEVLRMEKNGDSAHYRQLFAGSGK